MAELLSEFSVLHLTEYIEGLKEFSTRLIFSKTICQVGVKIPSFPISRLSNSRSSSSISSGPIPDASESRTLPEARKKIHFLRVDTRMKKEGRPEINK